MSPGRRPSFTRAFPKDPELDALVDAFERGNYARVRADGPKLALASTDEGVRRAARTLVERTRPDALAVGLLALAAALVGLLSVFWIAHGHPPVTPTPPAGPVGSVR